MTSERKIEANKRNAKRSTGPRTEAGKKKVSLNAVKHGLTATTVVVLPHEDAEAYRKRVDAWTVELNPQGDLGRYLAERAAKVSWQLDRADSYEQACLARRVRRAERELDEGGDGEAAALLKTLYETPDDFWPAGPRPAGPKMSSHFDYLKTDRDGAPAAESPAALVRKLEATAGGCRRLLSEWDRLREKAVAALGSAQAPELDPVLGWDWDEMRCAFRLLGLCQDEVKLAAALDRRLGLVAKVYAVVEDRACRKILLMGCDDDSEDHSSRRGPRRRRGGAPALRPRRGEPAAPDDRRGGVRPDQAAAGPARGGGTGQPGRPAPPGLVRRLGRGGARAPLSGPLEPHALPDPGRTEEPPRARGSPRCQRGGCPPVPFRRPARSRTRGRGPVILRILAPPVLEVPHPVEGPCSPAGGRGDAAKQTHRGRVNV